MVVGFDVILFEFFDLVVFQVRDIGVHLEYPIARCWIEICIVVKVLKDILVKVVAFKLLNILGCRRHDK